MTSKTKQHYCYLITDEDDHFTYVGYTVNPSRRIRQHRGEIKGGAKSTKKMQGTCKFVCVVGPFLNSRTALQFEWSMKHNKPKRHYLKGRMQKLIELLTIVPRWTSSCIPTKKHPLLTLTWYRTKSEVNNLLSVTDVENDFDYILPVNHLFATDKLK